MAVVHGETALDSFSPNANGIVRAIAVQADGKILVGGDFTALSPNGGAEVTRNRIARLNADGTPDTAFTPNVNNIVRAIVVQPDGKILVGGDFTSVNGETRHRLARLDATTGAPDAVAPDVSSLVRAIALQADGKVLIGGDFTSVNGETRNFIARLAADGSLDSLDPRANAPVRSIVVQPDGKILAGGQFNGENCIGGATRNYLARLDPATGLADSLTANANGAVSSIALQEDGKILVGGFFRGTSSIGGQARNRIARLSASTGLADSFNPDANGEIISIAVQPDGKVLVAGKFRGLGGQGRSYLARLSSATGSDDASFVANLDGVAHAIALQPDGKILVAGTFTAINDQARNRIARFSASTN